MVLFTLVSYKFTTFHILGRKLFVTAIPTEPNYAAIQKWTPTHLQPFKTSLLASAISDNAHIATPLVIMIHLPSMVCLAQLSL